MGTNMRTTVELITPEIAKEYLTHNTKNYRSLSATTVHNYAEDMKNGTFRENGEAIQFSVSGVLKNGQHRLHAIIESGVSLHMVVVRGVDDDCDEYDWGRARNIAQWGKANGIEVPNAISSVARVMVEGFSNKNSRGKVTRYIEEHYDDLMATFKICTYGKYNSLGRRGGVCLAIYVCRKLGLVNDDILRDFFLVFNTGNISPDQKRDPSPALIASRTFLTKFPPATGGYNIQKRQLEIIMLALKDFKANRNRRKEYPMDGTYGLDLLNQVRADEGRQEAAV